ncbi:MAG: hypothetical protein ACFCUM_13980 [Bacteroidales bacterium]
MKASIIIRLSDRPYLLFFLVLLILILSQGNIYGQDGYETFYQQSLKIQNTGMYVLGGWAVANIAAGGYGWAQHSGERARFDQMNLFWNVVNLSIAGFALYSNYNTDVSLMDSDEILNDHIRIENILLINALLDVGYIGIGLLMRHYSTKYPERKDLLRGYGSSIILQGSFLFVFDLVLYGFMRADRLEFLNNFQLSVSPEMTGIRFFINI